ncbi:GDP-L-fucose synthase [Candidatus Lokiarchaeum ossiferum]|uniref:GDP-L-fucose synthase n=1 Tax=Candidatus Lokiarchaeum ossiferum TaxID=2951803 RepID=A0ABY6HLY4_9ARCH|nr:GDP-L-fucose synthase [Candidatus Lokiarchaeum sp. B-35]
MNEISSINPLNDLKSEKFTDNLTNQATEKTYQKQDLGNCLVIGGTGLLGRALVQILENQDISVKIMDISNSTNHPNFQLGDITKIEQVEDNCRNIDTVFQTAAAIWDPKLPKSTYYDVNVTGNQNVVQICQELHIPRLIYTSTMDVVCSDEKKAYCNVDDSMSYPDKLPKDHYSRSKIIAEQLVLEANGKNGLNTCALRPVGMYGPGDKYHLANFIKMAQKKNKFRLGNGCAKFSHLYSENAAYAHFLAAQKLSPESNIAGKHYFITDYPGENIFDFMIPYLQEFGLCIPTRKVPYRVAYFLASLIEKVYPKATLNRFSVVQTCLDHTFISKQASLDFGYAPIISKETAFKKTVEWFKQNYSF